MEDLWAVSTREANTQGKQYISMLDNSDEAPELQLSLVILSDRRITTLPSIATWPFGPLSDIRSFFVSSNFPVPESSDFFFLQKNIVLPHL